MPPIPKEIHDKILQDWAAKGKILYGGFKATQAVFFPNATEEQIKMLRFVYMGGAQHLFASILAVLDEGTEATEKDMRVMSHIHDELAEWDEEVRMNIINPWIR